MDDHEGVGVVPGRYAGDAIPIHDGPRPDLRGGSRRGEVAVCVVELIGEFDAVGGLKHWTGFKSLAHSLSWACCKHPDAQTIRPRWAGERFDLNASVQALFTIELPEQQTEDLDQQAA